MKLLTQLLLTTVIACSVNNASAQTDKIALTGTVSDSTTHKILPGATVLIAAKGDTLKTAADANGMFRFNVQAGTYDLLIEHVGYATRKLDAVPVNKAGYTLQVILSHTPDNLGAVTVTAAKSFIVQKTDKITLNIAQSPLAAGDNVYEVIKRAPGMQEQGGLRFRGKSVTVLMDGRQLNLSGDDLKTFLTAMPANTVDKIEVLTQPSAKYDAQGGIVVNIVSAKNKSLGLNGVATAGIGSGRYLRYNGGISLNYRNSKMNVYGSVDYLHTKTYNELYADRKLLAHSIINDEQQIIYKNDNNTFKVGMDYDLSKRSSFGVLVKGIAGFRKKASDGTTINNYDDGNDSSSSVAQHGRSSIVTPAVNVYYKAKLGSKGGDLSLNIDYLRYNKAWKDYFTTRYFDGKGTEYANPYLLRDNSPGNNTIRSFTADYSFSANKIKYETGIKTVLTTTDNDIVWEQNKDGVWTWDEGKSNRFVYDENINAAYVTAASSWKKFDWQLGVRAEQTNSKGNSVTLGKINRSSYFKLFPSASIGFNQSEDQQFSLSYSRKIERFGFNIVNPFIVYQNQYAYSQGNPDIKPSFSDNFEAGWSYKNEWLVSLAYSRYTDVLFDVFKKDVVSGAMVSTYGNMNGAQQATLDVSWTKSFFNNKFTTSNNLGGLYAGYKTSGKAMLNQSAFTGYFSSQNTFMFGKGFRSELNISYSSPLVLAPYRYKDQFVMSAGISKAVLQKKGTITLSVSDMLNSARQRYTISSEDIYAVSTNKSESRFVRLTFNWKFGNSQVKSSKNRKSGVDDVQKRMN